jgi:hypothetical protein
MAKTLSDDLLALLDADTQTKVRAAMAANPSFVARDMRSSELFETFEGLTREEEVHTPPAAAHVPVAPVAASSASGNADSLAKVLSELQGLKTTLDTRLKEYVPMSKVQDFRDEIATIATKSADQYARVRENHRAEFGEPIDTDAFEKFIITEREANRRYPNMAAAHDVYVKDKRVAASAAAREADKAARAAEIAAGIEAGLKQRASGASVPGQTTSVAASPAQQVIAKAKAAANGGGADSAALKVARQLEELDRNRATVN